MSRAKSPASASQTTYPRLRSRGRNRGRGVDMGSLGGGASWAVPAARRSVLGGCAAGLMLLGLGSRETAAAPAIALRPLRKDPPRALRILRVPESYLTVAAALADARPGDHVTLRAGVYDADQVWVGPNVGAADRHVVVRARTRNQAVLTGRVTIATPGISLHGLRTRFRLCLGWYRQRRVFGPDPSQPNISDTLPPSSRSAPFASMRACPSIGTSSSPTTTSSRPIPIGTGTVSYTSVMSSLPRLAPSNSTSPTSASLILPRTG